MENKNITLNVTLDEANIILQALAKLPYEAVFKMIDKVTQQAQKQLQEENKE